MIKRAFLSNRWSPFITDSCLQVSLPEQGETPDAELAGAVVQAPASADAPRAKVFVAEEERAFAAGEQAQAWTVAGKAKACVFVARAWVVVAPVKARVVVVRVWD
jgi:hypothetical protein